MLYVHIDFPGKNKKVVCTTQKTFFMFFKNLQLHDYSRSIQNGGFRYFAKFKMAEYSAQVGLSFMPKNEIL